MPEGQMTFLIQKKKHLSSQKEIIHFIQTTIETHLQLTIQIFIIVFLPSPPQLQIQLSNIEKKPNNQDGWAELDPKCHIKNNRKWIKSKLLSSGLFINCESR